MFCAMDDGGEAEEEAVMILPADYSDEARALWSAALALNRAAGAVSLPPLLFFTDPARTPRPWETAGRLPAGAGIVFRAFGAPDAEAMGQRLRAATEAAGVRLLVGLDAALAERIGADGVHLPERAAHDVAALKSRRPDWIVTAAWHGAGEAPQGADALVLSPVFPPGGASAGTPALGVDGFVRRRARARVPVYALGGIGPDNAARLGASGACGLAGVQAIQAAFARRG